MIPIPIILCILLYLTEGLTAPPNDSNSIKEDLQDEYYTIATTDTDKYQPSDDRDAEAIIKSNNDPMVMFGIFLYREKIRRYAISEKIWVENKKIVDKISGNWWIGKDFIPQQSQRTLDLIFSLIYTDNVVLTEYLYNFFYEKLEKWITVALVLTKDMNGLITTYDGIRIRTFEYRRNDQDKPYKNMLRVWVRNNREPLEKDEPLSEDVKTNAETLKKDEDDDGFKEKRDQLELILMHKSIKFARAVILAFEKLNGDKAMEDILNENFKKCGLNENLADAYVSLASYIKDKPKYIAEILAKFSDGSDQWAVWMICIAVVQPQEWPKINEAFKKEHKGDSLSKFILERITDNKILAEAIAVAVDSTFKPTTFKEIPIDNSPPPPSPEKP